MSKNILGLIESFSGISKEESKKIFEEVKENHRKLNSCNNHSFSIDLNPEKKFNKKYQCDNCNGVVDSIAKSWYERGKKHATQ